MLIFHTSIKNFGFCDYGYLCVWNPLAIRPNLFGAWPISGNPFKDLANPIPGAWPISFADLGHIRTPSRVNQKHFQSLVFDTYLRWPPPIFYPMHVDRWFCMPLGISSQLSRIECPSSSGPQTPGQEIPRVIKKKKKKKVKLINNT